MCRLLMAYGRITTEGWLGMRWVKVGDGRDNGGAVHTASNVIMIVSGERNKALEEVICLILK